MKTIKKLLTLTVIIGAVGTTALVAGCQTATTSQTAPATSQKEVLLAQSGFQTKAVTTQKQQQHVSQLAGGRVSAVKYNGKVYYVYPTAKKEKIFLHVFEWPSSPPGDRWAETKGPVCVFAWQRTTVEGSPI